MAPIFKLPSSSMRRDCSKATCPLKKTSYLLNQAVVLYPNSKKSSCFTMIEMYPSLNPVEEFFILKSFYL